MGFGTPYMRFVRLDMGFINLTDIGYLETYIYVLQSHIYYLKYVQIIYIGFKT